MEINFKKLETYRPEIKLAETGTTIGSIVRWQRKQKNMTLNEGAEGICSISYLSKVENNLIEPSEQILGDLKRRFDLEDLLNYDLKRYEDHYNDIILQMFNGKEIPSLYLKIYENQNDYKSKLILFAIYLEKENLGKVQKIYKELEFEINKFNHDEINLFYFFTGLMLMYEGKYHLALKVLKLSNVVDKNSKLSMLIDYYMVFLKLQLGKYLQSIPLSRDLKKRLLNNHSLGLYESLLKIQIFLSLDEFDYDFSNNLIEEKQFLSKKEKSLAKMFLNLSQDKKINVSLLEKNISESDYWYRLALIYFDKQENYNKIKEVMKNSTKYQSNPINEHIEFFLDSKYTLDNDAFARYIRNITSNFESNYNGYYILLMLFENASKYYENKTFYKTANLIRKYGKKLSSNLKRMS
ncbi:MAG: helix-turn-helix domain-containing protein [Acholeplasmataceae bacterium]|jgi:transcriptional regulator with XRE-family HTH domain